MAPHRLSPRHRLRDLTATEKGWRWWIIRHTPTILIDYVLEVLLTLAAVITAAAFFTGYSAQSAVVRLLPDWLGWLYAILLTASAGMVTWGLAVKQYGTLVAYGMRSLALASGVYALAAGHFVGAPAVAPIVMSSVLGVLALWRGFLLHSTFLYLAAHPELRKSA